MNFKLSIFSLILLIFASCAGTIENCSLQKQHLKGKVKSVRQRVYLVEMINDSVTKGKEMFGLFSGNGLTCFDQKGFKISYIECASNDDCSDYPNLYKYNKRGLLIEESEFGYNGRLKFRYNYKYSGSPKKLKVTKLGNIEKTTTYILEYDKHKNLINESGNIYKYDLNNNLIESNSNSGYSKTNYEYDAANNKIKMISKGMYTTVVNDFENQKFDTNGNWTLQLEFKNGEPKFITDRVIEYY